MFSGITGVSAAGRTAGRTASDLSKACFLFPSCTSVITVLLRGHTNQIRRRKKSVRFLIYGSHFSECETESEVGAQETAVWKLIVGFGR